jgi:hypothetical protein
MSGPERPERARRLLLAAPLLLAGCGALLLPRALRIDAAELAERLARRFPIERDVLGRYALRLAEPQLQLLPQDNRLALQLALHVADRRAERRIDGTLAFDFGLRFEASDASLRLQQPRLRGIDLGDAATNALLAGTAGLAERWLDDLPVYTVPPARLQALRAAGLQPGLLRVVPGAVLFTLEAVPSR